MKSFKFKIIINYTIPIIIVTSYHVSNSFLRNAVQLFFRLERICHCHGPYRWRWSCAFDAFYTPENKYKYTSPVGLIMCRTETISVIYYQNFTSLLFWNISIISSDIGHLLNVLSSTKTNKNEFIILQIMNELTTISS